MSSAGIKVVSPAGAPRVAGDGVVGRRVLGLVTAVSSGALLVVSATLTPSESGLGTHTQLMGQVPCHWIRTMDCPCPTCGMTTAFAHAADGNLLASFLTQPLGSLLALSTAMAFLLGAYVVLTGSRVAHRLTRLWRPRLVWVVAALVLGSWFYKIVVYKGWL